MKKSTILLILILVGIRHTFAQGFVNLDFESANLSGYTAGSVPASNAIPGWTAYIGGVTLTNINYDTRTGGGVDLLDSGDLQGIYWVMLEWDGLVNQYPAIGQTGTIPATAQSLIWWGSGQDVLSFNGQTLSFSLIGNGAHYGIFGADISAFAGQTGQLLFTSTGPRTVGPSLIDNIQFSSSPIPEPSAVALILLGSVVFIYVRRTHKRQFHS